MNISEAKQQIKNAVTAYFTKDEFGYYKIPLEKQRPLFLMGPPGIGKTAIMEQVASELGVGLVSYSMAHHTRQSALGLPLIEKKVYGGQEYTVSEYTMSEIIAAVYDMMEETGVKRGILFLDEINCVSETLAPSMLQFLQYKIFGRHRVPDGWIVVTAGNPPEYNRSVREFDIVTWDRLKRIDIEPDFDAWRAYAYQAGVHPAVMTYLSIKKDDFYLVETTVEGKRFVTARGWEDLSKMIQLYEEHDIPVDELLVGQYLQDRKIAKDFAIYYDLYRKYRSDYQVDEILAGTASEDIKRRAQEAKFDERLSLLGLLLDAMNQRTRDSLREEELLKRLLTVLKELKGIPTQQLYAAMEQRISVEKEAVENGRKSGAFSPEEVHLRLTFLQILEQEQKRLESGEGFAILKTAFDNSVSEMKAHAKKVSEQMSNLFRFCEEVFREGQEILLLVTELTVSESCATFISRYGCPEYFAHNKDLLFYERQQEIIEQLDILEL